jgi:glycyl-tRNA synthetase beta chain
MAELLLELFSEEIPASLQIRAVDEFKTQIAQKLKDANIQNKSVECYATPRRVSLVINGVAATQKDSVEEKRGPRVDAPEQAVQGFLRSTGQKLEDLEKRKTDKGEFYFSVVKKKGEDVSVALSKILQDFICSYTWAKSMRWGDNNIRWIRPLHNILCIFDGKVVPIEFGHLSSNDKSFGHRFLSPKEFKVTDFADYKKKLNDNFVVLDIEDRKKTILEGSEKLAKTCGLELKADPRLLDEIAGLVEYPVALLGRIEEKFMSVPQEALISAMRTHQKYFSLLNSKGELAPYFITVSNMKSADKGAQIISGNERVLRARLEDAKFFWDQDRKTKLEDRISDLEKVVFHAKLGSVADKITRMSELSKLLSVWIPHANLILVERAAKLCKVDLTTEMVGEFPELQGVMGSYYAIENGEEQAVADAIKEHYSPMGPGDACPTAPLSIAVSLSDKIDSLIGLFAVGEKPTGSKDPYALRRAALGVIRIILENNLRIPLSLLFEKAIDKYPKAVLKEKTEKKRKLLPVVGKGKRVKIKKEGVINELLEFLAERLRYSLKEQNIRHDLIQAVFDGGNEDDLNRLVQRVKALEEFLGKDDGANLLAAYKRAANIVAAEEKKDKTEYSGEADASLLKEKEEKDLHNLLVKTKPEIEKGLKDDDFAGVMKTLAKLRKPVDSFFDKVIVNDKDKAVRENRLLLLSTLREFVNRVANFGEIEG